jgi:hypothetical protein
VNGVLIVEEDAVLDSAIRHIAEVDPRVGRVTGSRTIPYNEEYVRVSDPDGVCGGSRDAPVLYHIRIDLSASPGYNPVRSNNEPRVAVYVYVGVSSRRSLRHTP